MAIANYCVGLDVNAKKRSCNGDIVMDTTSTLVRWTRPDLMHSSSFSAKHESTAFILDNNFLIAHDQAIAPASSFTLTVATSLHTYSHQHSCVTRHF